MSEYEVSGTVNTDGSWTQHSVVRETHSGGSIDFEPEVKAGSSFCMRLRNALNGEIFSDEVCWSTDEYECKTLATDVIAGTRFTIDARGTDEKTRFSGKLFTA
jgi:hypothetical protein